MSRKTEKNTEYLLTLRNNRNILYSTFDADKQKMEEAGP